MNGNLKDCKVLNERLNGVSFNNHHSYAESLSINGKPLLNLQPVIDRHYKLLRSSAVCADAND